MAPPASALPARLPLLLLPPAPLRLQQVEDALVGKAASSENLAAAAGLAVAGAAPLPDTAYKLKLIPGIVRDALEQAVAGGRL